MPHRSGWPFVHSEKMDWEMDVKMDMGIDGEMDVEIDAENEEIV